ncbi:hypothetical protein K457DRAFT_17177 [Linnemannia elongata AG-77]|uniref:HCP-like protein n=1 Tax=Linnemannia elongata AG-77 TaxID=1314771 RepID=A0A197K1V5_9FUNG|nr:hypothetical protein K457DRAFT_17177 [Linnemannia elongata AG-77]
MTKEQQDTQPRHLQPLRPAYTHNTTSPPPPYTDNSPTNPDVVQVTIYQDPATGKEIVFWEDVLVAFKGALSIRQGARVLPFLRGSDFKILEPLRIAAVPDTVLDVHMEEPVASISTITTALAELQATVQATLAEFRSAPSPSPIPPAPLSREDMAELCKEVAMALSREFRVTSKTPTSPSARYSVRTASPAFSSQDETKDHHHIDISETSNRSSMIPTGATTTQRYDASNRLSKRERMFPELAPATNPNVANLSRSSSSSSNHQRTSSDSIRISPFLARTLTKAKQGSVTSQFALAEAYKNGTDGLAQNDESALEWYTEAATRGHLAAQVAVGDYYNEGLVVKKDFARAFEWYLRAAKQENVTAQSHVGFYYRMGQGVKVDKAKAMEWFTKAANGGSQYARVHCASLKAEGYGRPYSEVNKF